MGGGGLLCHRVSLAECDPIEEKSDKMIHKVL